MSDSLSVISECYPHLARVLETYIQRLRALPNSEACRSWLWDAAKKIANDVNPQGPEQFQEWDQIASSLDADAVYVLSQRFLRTLPPGAQAWRDAYRDQFLHVVTELLAYAWVCQYKNCMPSFIKEGRERRPDLLGGETVVVEAKHFGLSKEVDQYFARRQCQVQSVSTDGGDLRTKILRTIDDDVLPKFNSYPPEHFDRYLFADLEFDPNWWGQTESIDALIAKVRGYLEERQVKLVAVQWHSLRQPLTPDEFQEHAESVP